MEAFKKLKALQNTLETYIKWIDLYGVDFIKDFNQDEDKYTLLERADYYLDYLFKESEDINFNFREFEHLYHEYLQSVEKLRLVLKENNKGIAINNLTPFNTVLKKFYQNFQSKISSKLISYSRNDEQPAKKTKAEILSEQLSQYGFFELEKVKTLSAQSKVSIIEKIAESDLPYVIAMFDFLDFILFLERKHFDSKRKLEIEISKWFNKAKDGRGVRGNINSLAKCTSENKTRYSAWNFKQKVKNDYELLK